MVCAVIAGDYVGHPIRKGPKGIAIADGFKLIYLTKDNVKSYKIITEDICKSAASGISRGIVDGALLGPVGLLEGTLEKNKDVYHMAIQFRDSKRSLLEVDDIIYRQLVKDLS